MNHRTTIVPAIALAAAAVSSPAAAAVVISNPASLTLVNLGVGNGAGFQNNTTRVGPNATVTFSGATTGIYSGTNTMAGANLSYRSPFAGAAAFNPNQDYYAVQPGGAITIAYTTARTTFAALIGTIDSYNMISFSTAGLLGMQSFSGTDIGNALGFTANGTASGNIMFSGLNSFNTVTLRDSTNSAFEFIKQSSAAAVPEPVAWALLVAGVGLVGLTMRRRATVRVSYAV